MKQENIPLKLETKKNFQDCLLALLEPLGQYFSPGDARVRLRGAGASYCQDVMELEAFARPLWGLVPFWAGGGRSREWEERYRRGLRAGTDPDHPEYWGDCGDCDQRFVEMAPIAFGLLLTPEILWDPLSEKEKEALASWLLQINSHTLPKCNWYFFRILVNTALRKRDCSYDPDLLERDLAEMEGFYLGNGWYADGISDQKDYYIAFAMHFYSLLYAVFSEDTDPERCERFRDRAKEFGKDFLYWFSEDGAGLPFGRSLTYRMAQSAFWSAALFGKGTGIELETAKGLIVRNLQYWLSKEIFQNDGVLSVGYGYPNLTIAEKYNAPGSPYWCTKAFLFLALPDNHPFWEAKAAPLPPLQPLRLMKEADMLIQHRGWEVTAYVPAVYNWNVLGHFTEKYAKFAYSSTFAFSVAHSGDLLSEGAPDSMLAFEAEDGRIYVRKRSRDYSVEKDRISFHWLPCPGVEVFTEIRPVSQGHVRRHRIKSQGRWTAYDCGFAVGYGGDGLTVEEDGESLEIRNQVHGCRIKVLSGRGLPWVIDADPNTNLLYKNTKIPAIRFPIEPGETMLETVIETF